MRTNNVQLEPKPPPGPLVSGDRSLDRWRPGTWVGLSESKFAVFLRRRRTHCLSSFRWLTFYLRGRLVSVFREERATLTTTLLGRGSGPVWSRGGRDFPSSLSGPV